MRNFEGNRNRFAFSFIIACIIGLYFLFKYPGPEFTNLERACYFVVLLFAYEMLVLLVYMFSRQDFYIFEPMVIIWAMFFCTYGLQPLIDILNHSTSLSGVDTIDGGIKCTVIVGTSFFILFYFYYKNKNRFTGNIPYQWQDISYRKYKDSSHVAFINLVIWEISFLMFFLYLYKARGLSFKYILSAGTSGAMNSSQVSSTPLGFLSNFSTTMIASYMYYLYYGKSKILKVGMFIGTMLLYILNGYRFVIVIFLLSLMVHYYITRGKKPSWVVIGTCLLALLLLSAMLAATRNSLRHGGGWALTTFSLEVIVSPFESNFILYKPFWRLVQYYPSQYGYTLGYQMIIYTIIMFVPRALWPGKPGPPTKEVMMNIFSNPNIAGTQAFSSIGEYYHEFGTIGSIILMGVFGSVCGKLNGLYVTRSLDDQRAISYSVAFPVVFSLINAGYTPANFYMVLFAYIPIIFVALFVNKEIE